MSGPPVVDHGVRERIQDAVGGLQSIASRLRKVIQDTRSYTQQLARERGVDAGAVERGLTRAEDQLSRADAQVVALSQIPMELDAGASPQGILVSAQTQLPLIQTTLLSARDLLHDALGQLRTLYQIPTPTVTGARIRVTATPSP